MGVRDTRTADIRKSLTDFKVAKNNWAQQSREENGMQIIHNKLVRDNIPQIIRRSGKLPVYHQLDDVSYQKALEQKLSEEVQEYLTDKNLEEMADILEVLFAICKARGYTVDELMEKKREKEQERGGFSEKFYLEYVEEGPER